MNNKTAARAYLLRRAMEINGWKAAELGRRIGRDGNTVRRWMNGTTTPGTEDLVTLAAMFGIPIEALISPPAPPVYPLDEAMIAARDGRHE